MTPGLTQAQKTTLKNFINTTPTLKAFIDTGRPDLCADALNASATPDFWAWRTKVARNEIIEGLSLDGTTFDWASPGGFIARSQGERDAFSEIWNHDGNINPSFANVRTGWDDIFSGTGAGAVNNRAHFKGVSRRLASLVEKTLATGTGSTAAPAVMGSEGPINVQEVENALITG